MNGPLLLSKLLFNKITIHIIIYSIYKNSFFQSDEKLVIGIFHLITKFYEDIFVQYLLDYGNGRNLYEMMINSE